MSDSLTPQQRIADLEARQDEVLRELDALDQRVMTALREFGGPLAAAAIRLTPGPPPLGVILPDERAA